MKGVCVCVCVCRERERERERGREALAWGWGCLAGSVAAVFVRCEYRAADAVADGSRRHNTGTVLPYLYWPCQ